MFPLEIIYICDSSGHKGKAVSAPVQNSRSEKVLRGGSCADPERGCYVERHFRQAKLFAWPVLCLHLGGIYFHDVLWHDFQMKICHCSHAWNSKAEDCVQMCEAARGTTGMQRLEFTKKRTKAKYFVKGVFGGWVGCICMTEAVA